MKGWLGKENRSLRKPITDDRTPKVFLTYQQKWSADDNPVKVIEKSRRIGLSWGEAGEDALLAASESGMDVFYIGYNKDMALEFIEDCATNKALFHYTGPFVYLGKAITPLDFVIEN